ncbi:MAG: hypothetical protein KJ058_06090 [Thermoanaerobaculia bacterium]|nr:hypothetical protein [Thermoanaerobaculia bacterium]
MERDRIGRELEAALPEVRRTGARRVRVLVALGDEEADILRRVARERGAPLAATVRDLAVTAGRLLLPTQEETTEGRAR